MAVQVNTEEMKKREAEGGAFDTETQFIPEGSHPAVLVGYAELGKHYPIYKGVRNKYESGKRKGQDKPAELLIHLTFEFPGCPYDNKPLTIETSIPFGDKGEFINKLPVHDDLGSWSLNIANRTAYMKYYNAMNIASGCNHPGLYHHVGSGFLISVTNKDGKPNKDKVVRTYANMKPIGITKPEFRHPVTQKVETIDIPEPKGTYGPIFDWDLPTVEAWEALGKQYKDCVMKAVNFNGSPIQALLADMPDQSSEELPAEEPMPDNEPPKKTGKAAVAADDLPV